MRQTYSRYTENFPEEFSIKEKKSNTTEKKNFHLHKQLEIVLALSDNLKCKFENGIIDIPQNSLILFNQMDLHYIYSEAGSGSCHRYVLYFSTNYISQFSTPEVNLLDCFLFRSEDRPVVIRIPEAQFSTFLSILDKLKIYNTDDEISAPFFYGKELYSKFLLGEFLLLTNQLYREQFDPCKTTAYQNHAQLVFDICDYVSRHYDSDLSLDKLSRLFLISKTQLYNIFREVYGTTVSDYIAEMRITKAKDYLINTDYSVEMISQAVGYLNISSFSRGFKNKVGCSPISYRKRYENG